MNHGPCIAAVCDQYTCVDSWVLMEKDISEKELSHVGNVGHPI